MRDIKFRAWGINQKSWVTKIELTKDAAFMGSFPAGELMPYGKMIWCQYTGLKDKNGKEIYEGDILKCRFMIDYDLFREPEFVEVKFEDGQFTPMTLKKMTPYRILPYWYDYEVVGNIYENPDGLTESEKEEVRRDHVEGDDLD